MMAVFEEAPSRELHDETVVCFVEAVEIAHVRTAWESRHQAVLLYQLAIKRSL